MYSLGVIIITPRGTGYFLQCLHNTKLFFFILNQYSFVLLTLEYSPDRKNEITIVMQLVLSTANAPLNNDVKISNLLMIQTLLKKKAIQN